MGHFWDRILTQIGLFFGPNFGQNPQHFFIIQNIPKHTTPSSLSSSPSPSVREIRALSHRYHVGDDSQHSSATMLRVCLFRYQTLRSPPVSVFTTLVPQSCSGDLHTCCSHCVSRVACRLRARVVVVEPPTAS